MRLFRRFLVVLWVALVACVAGPSFGQTSFSTVVVFGDSLSDTGNIAHLTQSQYKIRFPADNQLLGFNYTDGRFTDGTDTQPAAHAYQGVWIEQLLPLFGSSLAVKDSLDGGTNYAFGDATTGAGTTTETRTFLGQTLSITLENMGQQVTDYLATNPTPNAQTLYVLWGGANDLFGAASAGQDPVAAAQVAVQNELALVQKLMAAGATNFLIPNVPPLGGFATSDGAAAVTALNNASVAFAQGLATGLNALKQSTMGSVALTIYQPDILTEFGTIAAHPMSVGLSDVTDAAQGISASPDTYLLWDGLHPTTTGHDFAAAAAANLFSPLATSVTALSIPSAAVSGQSLTVQASVTGKTGTTASGLVSLFSGTTLLGSAALDTTGVGSITFTPSTTAGSSLALTAVYAGSIVNNPSTSATVALPLVSAPVGTTTTLAASSTNVDLNGSLTLTATVTPAVSSYGLPGGTVTFYDGSTALGSAVGLTSGVATLTTTSLAAGQHSLTAVFSSNAPFSGSTSAAVSVTVTPPGFTPVLSPTSLSVASGGTGAVQVSATPVGGFSGAITLSCGTLPAHFACSFSNTSYTIAAGSTTGPAAVTLTVATNSVSPAAARRLASLGDARTSVLAAGLFLPGTASLLLLCTRRRKGLARNLWVAGVAVVLAVSASAGLAGCGGGNSNNAPAGSYTVPVLFTPSTGTAQTVNLTVTVQ